MEKIDLLIVGGGSAGMAAAISSYDKGVKDILIVEKDDYLGGILNQCIHNGFGLGFYKEELTGPEFVNRLEKDLNKRNIKYLLQTCVLSISKDKVVTLSSSSGVRQIKASAIIFTSGCVERSAGAINLPGDRPSGVLTAGQAQRYCNIEGYMVGKKVFILGSGDIGLIMARRMTLEGAKVVAVSELMPYSNGLNRNIVQCLNDYNIPLILSHTVTKIIGKDHLEAVEVSEVDASFKPIKGSEKIYEVDTLLLSVGLVPNTNMLNAIDIEINKNKGPRVSSHYMTSLDGVFASGNALHVHDLVDNVVLESQKAGEFAARYLQGDTDKENKKIEVVCGEGIGYVLPNYITYKDINDEEKIDFKFRVKKPVKDIYIVFENDGVIIKKIRKMVAIPSEMEIISLTLNLLHDGSKEIKVYQEEIK